MKDVKGKLFRKPNYSIMFILRILHEYNTWCSMNFMNTTCIGITTIYTNAMSNDKFFCIIDSCKIEQDDYEICTKCKIHKGHVDICYHC